MIYLLLFTIITAAAYIYYPTKYKYLGIILTGLTLAIFVSIRSESITPDFEIYEEWYGNRSSAGSSFVDREGLFAEPFYFILNDIFLRVGANFRTFIFAITFISVSIKLIVFTLLNKNNAAYSITIAAYLPSVFILNDFIQFRAGCSIACILIGLFFLSQKSKKKFILMIIIASGFHISSILFLLVLIFEIKSLSFACDAVLIIGSFILLLSNLSNNKFNLKPYFLGTLDQRLSYYITKGESSDVKTANPIAINLILNLIVTYILYYYLRISDRKIFRIEPNLVLVCIRSILIGYIILSLFSNNSDFSLRLNQLFNCVIPIVFGYVFNYKKLYLLKLLIVLWIITMIYVNIFRENALVQPYELFIKSL
jgi:hypothetical protein